MAWFSTVFGMNGEIEITGQQGEAVVLSVLFLSMVASNRPLNSETVYPDPLST